MDPVPGPRRLTYDDLLLLPDDGLRHELIDGEHYVSPSPNTRHQALVGRLYFEIELCLRQHPGAGQVFLAPLDVVFTKWDVVEPDVLFIARDQLDVITAKNIQGAPALVVEVLSERTRMRDEETKRRLFDRGGVREYWIVDPVQDVVTVYRRTAARALDLAAILSHEQADVLSSPLVPGLAVPLTHLFVR
jgi:Uma2 family endonuclease